MWKVAAKAGAENPALGLGAQNFEYYWYEHRTMATDVRQPHSQPLQLFSELGVPGLVLWVAFVFSPSSMGPSSGSGRPIERRRRP